MTYFNLKLVTFIKQKFIHRVKFVNIYDSFPPLLKQTKNSFSTCGLRMEEMDEQCDGHVQQLFSFWHFISILFFR